jgi:hypothetical protein
MTMIELLAAVVLTSTLMVAVLGILLTMSAQRRALLATETVAPWREQLLAQLRWDFINARKMSWSGVELRLYGLGGRNFATASVTQRPCEVVYSIRRMTGRKWLLRSEIDLDSRSNRNVREELVCFGVERFDFRLLNRDEAVPQRLLPVPRTFRMILHGEAGNEPVIEQSVLLN